MSRQIYESRSNDGYLKIFDSSTDEKFKLIIESNVLKKYKFSNKVNGDKIEIVGQFEEKKDCATNVQKLSYEYALPSDVHANEVKITESEGNIQIEAPRYKIKSEE